MKPITVTLAASGKLCLQVDEHPIFVPADERGMRALVRILEERARDPKPTVGKDSSPIQYLVDKWLAEGNRIKDCDDPVPEWLQDMPINMEGIDLS